VGKSLYWCRRGRASVHTVSIIPLLPIDERFYGVGNLPRPVESLFAHPRRIVPDKISRPPTNMTAPPLRTKSLSCTPSSAASPTRRPQPFVRILQMQAGDFANTLAFVERLPCWGAAIHKVIISPGVNARRLVTPLSGPGSIPRYPSSYCNVYLPRDPQD